jgi:SAM-dependent methyltransferase
VEPSTDFGIAMRKVLAVLRPFATWDAGSLEEPSSARRSIVPSPWVRGPPLRASLGHSHSRTVQGPGLAAYDHCMPDPRHFEVHAEVYERARPPYPKALWARLRELGLLRPGTRVLELGAGTGQATGPMLSAGASVVAVEPGTALAERLSRRLPDAVVHVASAETVALPTAAFDLAVAATAVHWFDLTVVLPKVHQALTPAGHFAVWRTAFGDPSAPVTPFRQRVGQITAHRGGVARGGPGELDTQAWVDRLTCRRHFVATYVEQFSWAIELSAGQVWDLFTTFSDWSAAEVEQVAEAVDELGGRVVEHYVTPLIVLERVPAP